MYMLLWYVPPTARPDAVAMCGLDFSDRACRFAVGALRSGSAGHWTSAVFSDGSVSGSKADGSGTGSVLWSAALSADARGQLGCAVRSMPLPMIVSWRGIVVFIADHNKVAWFEPCFELHFYSPTVKPSGIR